MCVCVCVRVCVCMFVTQWVDDSDGMATQFDIVSPFVHRFQRFLTIK